MGAGVLDRVSKRILANGLTVLVLPRHEIPQVSVQLWYGVGSRHEESNQKGIAHLIEHMIFKGTKTLSESDINMITHKLSGYCNAFTSHDYTGYLFDVPAQHWSQVFPVLADCMVNCTFKPDLLTSELKAVIQELKMYNDDYNSTLLEKMLGAIFDGHPYRYPIIGYKHDLRAVTQDSMLQFYRAHYVPNNATLVLVGDVDPDEVYDEAQRCFGSIPASTTYQQKKFVYNPDIGGTSVVLYRDVQQPTAYIGWVVPGVVARKDYLLDVLSWVIGAGKGARLYNVIVNEQQLATDLESFVYDFFDQGLFFIQFQPAEGVEPETVIAAIEEELAKIVQDGISQEDLTRATKKTAMDLLVLQENNQKLAYVLGKYYTALRDETYLTTYENYQGDLAGELRTIMQQYLRPAVMHRGLVLPLGDQERVHWIAQQERSDAEDAVFDAVPRETEIEPGAVVHTIVAQPQKDFSFPQPEQFTLANGLRVFYYRTPQLPKIDVVLDFKAKYYYDPEDKQGLSLFLYDMLQEGTQQRSSAAFTAEVERHGMSLNTFPGHVTMNMLSSDAKKGFELLTEMLTLPAFDPVMVEQVRARLMTDVLDFMDNPGQLASQLLREALYQGHPYHKRVVGTLDSMRSITLQDITKAYTDWITPHGARLAVVGDISFDALRDILEATLGRWTGSGLADLEFPQLQSNLQSQNLVHYMNRDQTVLTFGVPSIDRLHQDFDKFLLFDQVFTGGAAGSMSSRLFALRERSGLFYTITGSLLAGSGKQPGIFYVKTVVSNGRLQEAEEQIKAVIDDGARGLTQAELEEAQKNIGNSLVENFANNAQIATTFLSLDQYGLPFDYFNSRVAVLHAVTKEEVQQSVAQLLRSDILTSLRVGRV